MGLYNFKKQFASKIKSGQKRHTIRARRRVEDKPGNTAYLYTGLRTKHVVHIFNAPYIKHEHIVIEPMRGLIEVAGIKLAHDEREALAIADGFNDWLDMMAFWIDVPVFEGLIHHWDYDRRWPYEVDPALVMLAPQ